MTGTALRVSIASSCAALAFASSVATYGQAEPTTAEREFELNITEERLVEMAFQRSTAVQLTRDDLELRVGAAVSASRIDVTLFGITGRVRFRGSLEAVRQRLFGPR